MAALLMGVVLWGCKTDRDESRSVTDNRLVARVEIDNAVLLRPDLWITVEAQTSFTVPQ